MGKNIEMQYCTDGSTYEPIYPKTLSSLIVDKNGNNAFNPNEVFEVGDVLMTIRSTEDLGESWKLCDGSSLKTSDYPEYAIARNKTKGYGGTFRVIEDTVNVATALGAKLLPVMYKGNYLFLVNNMNSNSLTSTATLYWHNSLEATSSEIA